jgi:membrane protease YdiL (CAAX protease family)
MKRILAAVFWAAVLCAAGFFSGAYFSYLAGGHGKLLGLGCGFAAFLIAASFGLLPGVRKKRAVCWGLVQAFWLIIGFMAMQIAGTLGCTLLLAALAWLAVHALHVPSAGMQSGALMAALAGYFASALWAVWYIGRLGPARVRDGSVTGIAWRRAPRGAYFTAALAAAVIIMVVVIIVHIFPPNMAAVRNMPSAKLFAGPGWPALVLLVLAVFIAPPVEEYVFRGGLFAALASRVSPFWAGVITTAVFMAVHWQEKKFYLPGFIDVGLMAAAAAWMRVRFGSIRPGILLHLLYNFGLMFAAGTLG